MLGFDVSQGQGSGASSALRVVGFVEPSLLGLKRTGAEQAPLYRAVGFVEPSSLGLKRTAAEQAPLYRAVGFVEPSLLGSKLTARRVRRERDQPTTEPSLKIGRYMPTTMLPTTPPMITMIIGSSRLDNASTALLTSVS